MRDYQGPQCPVQFLDHYLESPDGRFQLLPVGPAHDMGENGGDIGMFGGSEPYVISGIPPIPTITDIDVPAFGTIGDGITIHLKGQAND